MTPPAVHDTSEPAQRLGVILQRSLRLHLAGRPGRTRCGLASPPAIIADSYLTFTDADNPCPDCLHRWQTWPTPSRSPHR